MGFKKYDENLPVEKQEVSETVDSGPTKEEKINNLIDQNAMLEEEEKKEAVTVDQESLTKEINENRAVYLKYTKKTKMINYITTGVVLVFMVAAFVLTMVLQSKYSWIMYIALGVFVAGLIAMVVVNKINKSNLQKKAYTYIDQLYSVSAKYIYRDEKFSNVQYISNNQLDTQVFIKAHLYKNIKDSRSRNYVEADYKGKTLTSCDIAANILVKNRTSPMFLGKLYVFPNNYTEKDKVITFQLVGGELSKPIDDIDDLKLVDGNDEYKVYSNDEHYKKYFTSKSLSILRKFRIDKTLIDVVVSIREGYTTVGIDYVDEFLNIPVESDFNINTLRRTEKDLNLVLDFLDSLENK